MNLFNESSRFFRSHLRQPSLSANGALVRQRGSCLVIVIASSSFQLHSRSHVFSYNRNYGFIMQEMVTILGTNFSGVWCFPPLTSMEEGSRSIRPY